MPVDNILVDKMPVDNMPVDKDSQTATFNCPVQKYIPSKKTLLLTSITVAIGGGIYYFYHRD